MKTIALLILVSGLCACGPTRVGQDLRCHDPRTGEETLHLRLYVDFRAGRNTYPHGEYFPKPGEACQRVDRFSP